MMAGYLSNMMLVPFLEKGPIYGLMIVPSIWIDSELTGLFFSLKVEK